MAERNDWKAILIPSPDTAELLNTEEGIPGGRKGSPVVDATYDSLVAKV